MDLIVQNDEMKRLYRKAEKYATTNNNILILGKPAPAKNFWLNLFIEKVKGKKIYIFLKMRLVIPRNYLTAYSLVIKKEHSLVPWGIK